MFDSIKIIIEEIRAQSEKDGCATAWRLYNWADRLEALEPNYVGEPFILRETKTCPVTDQPCNDSYNCSRGCPSSLAECKLEKNKI